MATKTTLYRILSFIDALVIAGLLLSYLSWYISPETFSVFAFLGLMFPVFLVLNIILLLFRITSNKKKALLYMLVLLLGWNQIFSFFKFSLGTKNRNDGIAVLSYNVRLFDLYDWTKTKGIKQKITTLISELSPDVICFQEYLKTQSNQELSNRLNYPFSYEYTPVKLKNNKSVGSAIFSRYKIVNTGVITFNDKSNNHCIYSDIIINNDTIRIFNAHIGSIRFDYEDYTFISGKTKQEEITSIRKIISRLNKGFKLRAKQVEVLIMEIKKSPYPVLLCSDLNAPPSSYSYKQLSNILSDSFKQKGRGVGSTYTGDIPWLRIDYIWHSKDFTTVKFKTLDKNYSDHKPIIGNYKITTVK